METVLLAEDEPSVRRLLVRLLGGAGYAVLAAEDGRHALRLAGDHEGRIDLVITDVVMPRMGGVELVRRLSEGRPGTRVVYLSGYSAEVALDRAGEPPDGLFVKKPIQPAALLRLVREVLDARVEG